MKSILSKLWLGITSLVLIILLITWLFQIMLLQKFYIDERKDLLLDEGKNISALISATNDFPIISQEIIDEMNDFRSEFSFHISITIIDTHNKVLFPMNRNIISKRIPKELPKEPHVNLYSKEVETFVEKFDRAKRSLLVVKVPIEKNNAIVGNIILTSALAPIQETSSILKKQLSIITWISLLIGSLLALLFAKHFAKPILKITKTSKEISKGNFNVRVDLDSKDEIGILGDTINDLAFQLGKIENFRREFIANVSHELKTPISLIRAYAELVMDVDADKKTRNENLQVIVDESSRLNTMVEDILTLSKMEAGFSELNCSLFPIAELIYKVIGKLDFFASQKNIKLLIEIDDQNTHIYADEAKIYQVFFNLINNAITHSYENSQILIKVTTTKNHTKIEIIDHGQGIPKEDLPYIWDRFYKVDKSRKRDTSGTGLGMSIVKNILEAHNFSYGIKSKIHEGTTVWFEMNKRDT
ncbi:sensor histidine kinase [Crassaminicella profunda]|uniref:sensor histidine kinase n=1 Tax=Crassaminicella profunda TaxID=1286698 RepID=UPI001CA6C656|nr:ATP-binding protein [Crassaminicella profunda]QZY54894.1 HAMP domain-containing protein [Crassaminicella profunda]